MIWMTWRQFRTQAIVALAALAAAAIAAAVTGPQLAHLYGTVVATCRAHGDCPAVTSAFLLRDHALFDSQRANATNAAKKRAQEDLREGS